MYEREHQYDKIIDCYLHDPLREVSLKPASPPFPPPLSLSATFTFVEFLLKVESILLIKLKFL
jgi:hypothetical protein